MDIKTINAEKYDFRELNSEILHSKENFLKIEKCLGQRYIGGGLSDKKIKIQGTPGNALGSYLNGAEIELFGNAQDATGDTMNGGQIVIHGSSGDATGYAMRGGIIFVEGNVGYRAGIHMKAYEENLPVLVVGGCAGSFLGEYQAGGIIIILGENSNGKTPVGYFCGTGMHGGKMFIKTETAPVGLPTQIKAKNATNKDLEEINIYIEKFCLHFSKNINDIMSGTFYVLTPNTKSPYKQMYVNSTL